MNKNTKHIFLLAALVVLLVGLTAVSASDVSDNSTIDNTISHVTTQDTSSVSSVDNVQTADNKKVQSTKASADKKTVKTKNIKKETKEESSTVTDYDSLKTSFDNIEANGTSDTAYTINVKNGEYNFEDRLVLKDTNATHVNVIGEDVDKTVFTGQNKTRLFLLNNTKLNVTFKNITFKDVFVNESHAFGAGIEAYSALNVENCKFDNIYNELSAGGAIAVNTQNSSIVNSTFTNNYAPLAAGIFQRSGAFVRVDNCVFDNNSGAMEDLRGALNVTNSIFTNNHGTTAGVLATSWLYSNSPIRFTNCLFINNTGTRAITNAYGQSNAYCSFNYSYFEGKTNTTGMIGSGGSGGMSGSSSFIHIENTIVVLANGKSQGATFTQNDKTLTLKATALGQYNDHGVSNVGAGYSIPITTTSNDINTTDLVLGPQNNYTVNIDLTKLPADFEDFTVSADGIEVATVSYKKTDVTFKPVTAVTGSTITLNAVFTENGMPIEKGKVAFKINGKTIGHSDVQFGKATLTYKLPLHSAKDYTLNVVYGGNKDYNEARVNTTLTLTKINTKTIIQTANATAGNKMQINVKTLDANNNTVNGGKIAVKVNRKTVKVLNNTGNITVEFNVPKSWSNRNITVQTAFSGTGVYSGCRNETSLVVKQTKTAKKTALKQDTVQNSYYVSADNGSDTNTGSQTSPFKTIAHAISVVNSTKSSANIYLTGRFTGTGNTNLTVPGDLNINFIGLNNASIDGELNYTYKEKLDPDEYYWGSSKVWEPYWNGTGNWAMNITRGNGHITISNLTITRCWSAGGSSISAYPTATIDNYGNLEVNNVSFIYNCAGVGAGIRNNANATVTVTNSLFDANRKSSSTGNDGAGIYNNGTATIINSTFQNNYARWGTVTNDKVLTIINSTIRDNIAYDGGSTYKTGSGITINTGNTDFYNQGSVNSTIKTVIDGCTFINNDQLDVYADKGDLNLTNNVFNKSTGIEVPSSNTENLNIHYNIINNTITSPVGSTIYGSLSSSATTMITLMLNGRYNYTVVNNTVLDVKGNNNYALTTRANYATIANNTFTRQITINSGSYNTITNNNITTTLDTFAVILDSYSRNNNITDNYFAARSLRGNLAVNSSQASNTVKDNMPEIVDISIDDETYNDYFDENGNLLPDYNKVEQVRITGALANKNFNVNKTLSIVQTNNKITSENITITTTSTGKLEASGLVIENTNNRPAIILNSNNNKVTRTNLKTDAQYTITVTGENNTINSNQLIADMLVGNESVQASENNNITGNTPTYKIYILSDNTYSQYFNTNGTIKDLSADRDIHFLVNGTLSNKDMILDNNRTITVTDYSNPQLINVTITTLGTTNLNMSNINITNTNNKPAVNLNTPTNTIRNNNIKTNTNAVNIVNSTTLTLSYNNITANSTENVTAISIINSKNTRVRNINIADNVIETIGPATPVNSEGRVGTTGIEALNSTSLYIDYNNITTRYNSIAGDNDAVMSVNIINPVRQTVEANIYSNRIYTYGNTYAYGVNVVNQTLAFQYGYVTTEAKELAVGAQITSSNKYNYYNTNIYGVNHVDFISESPSIGVILNACDDMLVQQDNFFLNGTNQTGVLVFNTTNTEITSNIFTENGNNITAIEVKQSSEISIRSNTIHIQSNGNRYPVELTNTTNTLISGNSIITTNNYTIHIDNNTQESSITDNTLYAKYTVADNSVLKENTNNRVRDNNPVVTTKYYLNDETYSNYFDENGTLRDIIPEGLTIQVTGELHNKTLNITKPVNIIADGINFINTTVILTGDNSNITGVSFTGENNNIIINGNNNNIEVENFEITDTQTRNLTPIIITGNNNTFRLTNTMNIESTTNYTSNVTVITLTGNKNTVQIDHSGLNVYYYNNFTGIKADNTNNNKITYYTYRTYVRNANDIILTNSNNNNVNISRYYDAFITDNYTGLKLVNSSDNSICGYVGQSYTTNRLTPDVTLVTLENNSNNNIIDNLRITTTVSGVKDAPVQINNSNNNTIRYSRFSSGENYTVEIKESVGNTVEYNYIRRGDMGVIQENANDTVNNIVRYNSDNTGLNMNYFKIIAPDTVKMGDVITITANVSYYNNTNWRSRHYMPITEGIVTIEINGVAHDYLLEDGRITLNYTYIDVNYTVDDYNDGVINIRAIYKHPTRKYENTIITKTINVEKLETQVNLGNFTNNGLTSILTVIVTDIDGKIVDNGTVEYRVDDEVIGTVDITNKVAVLPVSVANYKAGVHNITATYNGNDYYSQSNTTGLLTVNKCKVTASITPVTAKAGETVTLTSIIRDVNGNLADNGIAVFKLNNKTLKDEFGENIYAQVHNGIASINYTIPDNYSAKNYNLTVVTSGDAYKRVENTTKLTITKHNAQILLEPQNITRTNNTNFKIEIVDENGNPITGSTKVAVKLNGKTQLHTRAANGVIDFNMDLTNYKHNSYELSIVIAGNSLYNNARATNMLFLK